MKRIIIIICLILLGVGIFSYPYISNWLFERGQSYAMQEYEEEVSRTDNKVLKEERIKAEEYNKSLTGENIEDPFSESGGMALQDSYTSVLNMSGIMGYIQIPDINVKLPIYHGTSEEVLKKGVGHLQGTSFPIGGPSTHGVLTGHTGLTSAKLFTDLTELKEGDSFYLHILDEVLAYQIDQIEVIEPSETSDLRVVEGQDYITLVTCTPYGINSHRLLVRGQRTAYLPELENSLEDEDDGMLGGLAMWLIIAAVLTIIIMVIIGIKVKQRQKQHQIEQMKQAWLDRVNKPK